ncbi:serine/threonine-protein kinase Nek8-like [Lycorma delicatula]|uniref:serine/threonine-protein kinase Nek8-like n=1 Tax=Lycorma delicatula TaxID=130591 RepID=UPI003F51867C
MDAYIEISAIGRGAFGIVHLCRRKSDNKQVVLKTVALSSMNSNEIKAVKDEVLILSSLNHPNIIKYYDSFCNLDNKNLIIVMDYAANGTLNNYIKKQNGQLIQQQMVMRIFAQLCLAVEYLHKKNIVHRDVTAHNVLLTGYNGAVVKLSDFGISKILQSRRYSNTSDNTSLSSSSSSDIALSIGTSIIGTQEYIAPEICYGKPYTKAADIWSLGCLLYYMITSQLPFTANNLPALVMKITNNVPDINAIDLTFYDEELIEIICNLLNKNQSDRPDIDVIKTHPFILKYVIDVGINSQFAPVSDK